MLYRIVLFFTKILLSTRFKIKAFSKENIPKKSGAILALNHRTNYDVLVAGLTCPRKLKFMAKAELFENPLYGMVLKWLGAFPVQRGKGDIGAIKVTLEKLKKNQVVLMFPEGRRIKEGEDEAQQVAKNGAVSIAIKAKVPIIPAYISGEYSKGGTLTITYGEPICFDEYFSRKPTPDEISALSENMMKTIRSLKVERYEC